MGLIGNILAAKLVAKLTERLDRAQREPPAGVEHVSASRAKLVAALGAAAIALLVAGLSRRRRLR